MEHKSNEHKLISDYLTYYHTSDKFIHPKLFRELSGSGLVSYINNLPGKSMEEDISLALEKYNAHLERRASALASTAATSSSTTRAAEEKGPPTVIEVKLTKKAIAEFLVWSKTRYNDYLGFGTKQENVNKIYNAFIHGHHFGKEIFIVECASAVGENYYAKSKKYWRTTGNGGDEYTINCVEKTITAKYRNQVLKIFP